MPTYKNRSAKMQSVQEIFRGSFTEGFAFESFGVLIRVESNHPGLLQKAKKLLESVLLGNLKFIDNLPLKDTVTHSGTDTEMPVPDSPPVHVFGIAAEDGLFFLYCNGELLRQLESEFALFRFFESHARLRIAEFAVGRVFVHAGVIGWQGSAVIIPANSYQGKTTLVAELVKRGAEYFSDEYAIFDEDGFVHPFPRPLTLRYRNGMDLRNEDVTAEHLGGRPARHPARVGLVLFTEYSPGSVWQIKTLTTGNGIIEVIPHTAAINSNPEFSLKVLKTALSRAIMLKGKRGEAAEAADRILSLCNDLFYEVDIKLADSKSRHLSGGKNE